jgi:hypothetical protein
LLQITDVNENERKIVEKHEKTDQEQIKEVENLKQQNLTLQLELAKNQGIIDTQKEEIQHLRSRPITPLPENQPSESLVNQIIIKLNQKQLSTSETQEILNQTKDYLGAKRIFLNTRQITIRGLQNCYNKLKGSKKYDKADEVGKIISAGGTVASSLTFGVPKAFGDTISTINSSFKKKFSDKREREFQELLVNDKENLFLLNNDLVGKVYSSLINNQHLDLKDCLESKEIELFSSKYKVFEIDSSI